MSNGEGNIKTRMLAQSRSPTEAEDLPWACLMLLIRVLRPLRYCDTCRLGPVHTTSRSARNLYGRLSKSQGRASAPSGLGPPAQCLERYGHG
jgi:hypothetical protein